MHIDAQGDWHHQNSKIQRPEMVQLFASILRREDDAYYLVTPHEKQLINVRDVPFQVIAAYRKQSQRQQKIIMLTNVQDVICANAEHPLMMRPYGGGLAPYIKVRDRLYARLSRNVYYQLANWLIADEDSASLGIWSFDFFHKLDQEVLEGS